MSGETQENRNLALELTEFGLSLFVCDGDEPLECIAHVDLDDPDFSKKLAGFRNAAETSVGKGFSTQIWLPDEQVMFRSLKLDEEDTDDLRQAASGALSASTPFQGDSLCFDLGDTNGAGYTPVAAIPREKMDEAMAFAKKMRMNPRLITTSNVVSGFSSRPDFKPFIPEVPQRAAPLRMAALAMMLAAPIFLMSTELEGGINTGSSIGNAYVASIETTTVETDKSEIYAPTVMTAIAAEDVSVTLPLQAGPNVLERAAPRLASTDLFVAPEMKAATSVVASLQSVFKMNGQLVATSQEASAVLLPAESNAVASSRAPISALSTETKAEVTPVAAQVNVLQPNAPTSVSQEISISPDDGSREISTNLPIDMFRPGPDGLPSLEMLAVGYVQNVFAGDIEIRDLMAVDEMAADTFVDPTHVRVANFGEDVLVRRPANRSAPKLVQPAFMPRPEKRPLPLLPEQAFDFNTMIPIDPAITGEDPPPLTSSWNDIAPSLERPQGLLFVSDEATNALIEKARQSRLAKAIKRADANRNGPLANLISPKVRSAVPLAGSNGAVAQLLVPKWTGPATVETSPVKPIIVASASTQTPPPAQLAAKFVAQPSLPNGLTASNQPVAVVRELVPYKPGAAALPSKPGTGIRFIDVASRPTLPRPPSRRDHSPSVAITPEPTPEPVSPDPVEPTLTALPEAEPAPTPVQVETEEVAKTTETQSSDLQEQIAAAALPELTLPRPPARPERTTDVAALIEQLEPATETFEPISKYAIASLYAPAKRPASLEAQAKKIIEQRKSVSFQVAKKQQPVAATPQKSLRIPTGARVGSAATIKDGIALGDISLIGIFGTKKTRRALVRLPQGRYVQVSRGDRLSGWTVSAVSEDAVRIQKGSKNKVLRLPN